MVECMRIAPSLVTMASTALAMASLVALTRQGPMLMAPQPGALALHPMPEPPLRGLPGRSDEAIRGALADAGGGQALARMLASGGLVKRVAAAVASIRERGLPRASSPLVAPGDFPLALATPLSREHVVRYEPFVRALESVDAGSLASLYVRLYPLFQEEWTRRGSGPRHFNDAVVSAIDHLLEAPMPEAPPLLVRRGAVMAFEDPAHERRSAGHKLMLRMGSENARRVKAVLAQLRERIALRRMDH